MSDAGSPSDPTAWTHHRRYQTTDGSAPLDLCWDVETGEVVVFRTGEPLLRVADAFASPGTHQVTAGLTLELRTNLLGSVAATLTGEVVRPPDASASDAAGQLASLLLLTAIAEVFVPAQRAQAWTVVVVAMVALAWLVYRQAERWSVALAVLVLAARCAVALPDAWEASQGKVVVAMRSLVLGYGLLAAWRWWSPRLAGGPGGPPDPKNPFAPPSE